MRRFRIVLLLAVVLVVGFAYGAVGADGPGGVWLPWVMAGVSWPLATPTATGTPTATATATSTATVTATPTRAPAPDVRIVLIDGADEYVIIRNVGTGGQSMSGWWLRSADGQSCQALVSQTFYFPSGYVLGAGASVRVTSGPGAADNPPAVLKWTSQNIWANAGDRGDLHDADGVLRSSFEYGSCD